MTQPNIRITNELKYILENIYAPEHLDRHPWVHSLTVQEGIAGDSSLSQKSPGYQLVIMLGKLFRQMMPSTPPRRGKCPDSRWCQFGMLAAKYYAPFFYGMVYPASLRDAWGRVDQVVPFFVFGKDKELSDVELERYRLFNDDDEPAPSSTLSDWHMKGLQRLSKLFLDNEQYLSRHKERVSSGDIENTRRHSADKGKGIFSKPGPYTKKKTRTSHPVLLQLRNIGLIFTLILLVISVLIGVKIWNINKRVEIVRHDISQLQVLRSGSLDSNTIQELGSLLSETHQDSEALSLEAKPVVGVGRWLGWVPVYGGDLAASRDLIEMVVCLTDAADQAYQAVFPVYQEISTDNSDIDLPELTNLSKGGQSLLMEANAALACASEYHSRIDPSKLSPGVQELFGEVDKSINMLQDVITTAQAFPTIVGASGNGPQTYLLLLLNEDELRSTGGFITAAGTVVFQDGDLIAISIEDSPNFDDLTKPYPTAPRPMIDYMNIHRITLRDSNWSPDFPTSAALAERLFVYSRSTSVDGVVALDQHAVVLLLSALGQVRLPNVPYPITADNVIKYMRAAKGTYSSTTSQAGGDRKSYLQDLTKAILSKIISGQDFSLNQLIMKLSQALEQHHILLQMDDPTVTELLSERGWDGAVRSGSGDFLMVIDTNIGYNKVNALIDTSLVYQVDLSNPLSPISFLTVTHTNRALSSIPCVHWQTQHDAPGISIYEDQMNRCYWDYLRVYTPVGSQLLDATPQFILGKWMILGQFVPGHVDVLDEGIEGVQGFGTLLVVPGGASLETSFHFALPSMVVDISGGRVTYNLWIQKQPGTLATPISICVRLPRNAVLVDSSLAFETSLNGWCNDTTLQYDLEIELDYQIP